MAALILSWSGANSLSTMMMPSDDFANHNLVDVS
jgi:hypothetical protein